MFNGAHPSVMRVGPIQFLEPVPATPLSSWSRATPHRGNLTDSIFAEARLNAGPSNTSAETRRPVICPSPVRCLSGTAGVGCGDSNYAIVSRPMGAEQTIGQCSSSNGKRGEGDGYF